MIKRLNSWPAVIAASLMALWPAAVLSLAFSGVGTASIWCSQTPALVLNDEDRARLADLSALLGEDSSEEEAPSECPDCSIAGGVLVPEIDAAAEGHVSAPAEDIIPSRASLHTDGISGPPSGSRAPPVVIL